MSKNENIPFDYYPRRLNDAEISNPHLVIEEFFDLVHLPDCRKKLRDWLHAGLAEPCISEHTCPANLFSFYEYVEKLIEAAHLIKEQGSKFDTGPTVN